MGRRFWVAIAVVIMATFTASAATAQDVDVAALASAARADIAAGFDDAGRANLEAVAAAETTAEGTEGLAIAMLLNRHLDESAFLYALAAERGPSNAALMTSLGAVALEMQAAGRPVPSLDPGAVVQLQRAALALEPDDPSIMHNLATALRRVGGEEALAEALALLRQAAEAEPGNSLFGARLAEALMDAGLKEEAKQALNRVFVADPASVSVSMANSNYFGGGGINPPAGMCSIDFRCDEVCPGGIIGRINYVTCEIENSSAVSACQAGQPFPVAFNCEAQMPRFGILIPGLDPGFSILTPWGSIDVLAQGDGRIDFKVRISGPALAGPLKTYMEGKGSYQPSSGELRIQGGGGVSLGLPATNNPAADTANSLGFGPSIRIHYNHSPGAGEPNIEPSIRFFRGKVVG
ncbi:MAG: tetratricopeptide repeat protein [Devosia sp.]